jgi:putative endonuclease
VLAQNSNLEIKFMLSNKEKGDKGEQIATDYLIKKGYQILERNWRHHHLEVDIIASKEDLLHIIEVKTRHSLRYGRPEEGITRDKMTFLKNAAEAYQFQHPYWKYLQFDVIAITIIGNETREIFMIEDVYF